MALELGSLQKAIASYEELFNLMNDKKFMGKLNAVAKKGIKAGLIKNFEFTYELCWKFMKRWLEQVAESSFLDGMTKKELFRMAAEHHLIGNVKVWFEYHEYRNETAHTYNEETAEKVYKAARRFFKDAKAFLKNLEAKND